MVAKIDNDIPKNKKITVTNYEDEGEQGSEHNKYYQNGNIKKIATVYYGGHGNLYEEYYFGYNPYF